MAAPHLSVVPMNDDSVFGGWGDENGLHDDGASLFLFRANPNREYDYLVDVRARH